jgi:hypothetical protein
MAGMFTRLRWKHDRPTEVVRSEGISNARVSRIDLAWRISVASPL